MPSKQYTQADYPEHIHAIVKQWANNEVVPLDAPHGKDYLLCLSLVNFICCGGVDPEVIKNIIEDYDLY